MQIENGNVIIDTNMKCQEGEDCWYYSVLETTDESVCVKNAWKLKGVVVERKQDIIKIYNDPFSSIPIYVYAGTNQIIVSTYTEFLRKYKLTLDRVGVYEELLFESPLYDRTIFNEVKELPAASCVEINTKNQEFFIKPYWNYDIAQIDCDKDEAIDKTRNALEAAFRKIGRNEKLLMGLSGGLDSRLSMLMLQRTRLIDRLKTFTFGYTKRVLDFKFAHEVAETMDVENYFIKTDDEFYLKAVELPIKTLGGVSLFHGHIYNCLRRYNKSDTFISNYYSDAVMGYDCRPIEYDDILENCDYYKKLKKSRLGIDDETQKLIINDLRKIIDRRSEHSNFSSINEFIYIIERNPKFHMKLSFLFFDICKVEIPYADIDLLQTVISLPQKYRYYKNIEHMILDSYFVNMKDVSSTRYATVDKEENSLKNKLYYNAGYLKMLFLNRINAFLIVLSSGCVSLNNKYITENHLAVYTRLFKKENRDAAEYFRSIGLFDDKLTKRFTAPCFRTADAQQRMINISFFHTIRHYFGL